MKKLIVLLTMAGMSALPLAADTETLPSWTYYTADDAENPFPGEGIGCLSNETWMLCANIRSASANTLIVSPRNDHENAFLNGVSNAETLDLRGTITSPDGETTYTISHIAQFALGADPTKGTPRAFIAPTTVNGGLWGWFHGITKDANGETVAEPNANYTNITIDIPGWFETINYYQVPRTSGEINWTLRLPQLRQVSDGALTRYQGGDALAHKMTGTFDENTFPSLRRIGNNAMSNQKFAGRLYLPALETVYDWGINGNTPGFTEIVLSPTKNSIYTLGKGCLGWLYNVTNVVIGLSPTNRLSDQAFSGNTKMTRVEFTGSPPNFTSDAANVFTGPGALGITFIAPDTSAWQAFLKPFETSGDFVRWSNESIRAAHNANPNKPTVIGTGSANVFRSNQQHYLAVAREPLTDWIDFDPFFGDQVTCDFTPDAEGRIPMGVTVTFTAVPNTSRGGVFAGWYGDVPGGKCMDASITVHLRDKPNGMRPYIFARFTHPWALIDDGGSNVILDNGQFRINGVVNGRNVSFARGSACSLYADDNTGSGVLDLGGMVTNVAGETYTIVNIKGNTGALAASKDNTVPAARMFVTPGTMTGWNVAQHFHATNRRASYETVVVDEPNVSGGIFCAWMFSDHSTLKHAIFRGEGLKFGSVDGVLYNTQVKYTDVGWWHLPGVTSIPNGQISGAANQRFYGSWHLPFLTKVGNTNFKGNNNLNEVVFGDGDKNSRVTSIGTDAFNGASGLTNVVLNAAANLTVGANAFAGASGIKTVTFLGPAVSEDAFGGILAGVAASDTAKPVIVYVSEFQPTWLQTGYVSPVDPSEAAYLPAGERVLGVYRAGEAAPSGKAWVCHRPSSFDPKGTRFIIR